MDGDPYDTTWAPLDNETVGMLVSMRVDIACILEADEEAPPVFFKNRDLLVEWTTGHGLEIQKVGRAKLTSAIRVCGFYTSFRRNVSFGYGHVWVRASYTAYARRLRHVAQTSFNIVPTDWAKIDADHVINRASLAHHPDAWVALFPVDKRANRHFGAAVETRLPKVRPNVDRINLPPIAAFKLFCGRMPTTPDDFGWAMSDIRNQFDPSRPGVTKYCDDIERDARSILFEDGPVTVERSMLYIYKTRGRWGFWTRMFTWVLRPDGRLTGSADKIVSVFETLEEARTEVSVGSEIVARLLDGRFAFNEHPSLLPLRMPAADHSDAEYEIIEVWA